MKNYAIILLVLLIGIAGGYLLIKKPSPQPVPAVTTIPITSSTFIGPLKVVGPSRPDVPPQHDIVPNKAQGNLFTFSKSSANSISPNPGSLNQTMSANDILKFINQDRVNNGLKELTEDVRLDKAAQEKADAENNLDYFGHIGPDNKTMVDFLKDVNYSYVNIGENLAIYFQSASSQEVGWMNSTEHRANILNPVYTNIGIGIHGQFIVVIFADQK